MAVPNRKPSGNMNNAALKTASVELICIHLLPKSRSTSALDMCDLYNHTHTHTHAVARRSCITKSTAATTMTTNQINARQFLLSVLFCCANVNGTECTWPGLYKYWIICRRRDELAWSRKCFAQCLRPVGRRDRCCWSEMWRKGSLDLNNGETDE